MVVAGMAASHSTAVAASYSAFLLDECFQAVGKNCQAFVEHLIANSQRRQQSNDVAIDAAGQQDQALLRTPTR